MASAGKVSPVVKGAWNSAVSYTRLDIVSNATNTRSYIARKDSINVPLENTEYWQILADVADTADKVNYDNTTSKLTATKVQDAIDELAGRKIDIDDTMSDTSTNVVQNKVIKKYADDIDSKYSQLSGRNLLLNSDFRVNQRQGKLSLKGVDVWHDADCTSFTGHQTEDACICTLKNNGNYKRVGYSGYVKPSDVVDGYVGYGYGVDRWDGGSSTSIKIINSDNSITLKPNTSNNNVVMHRQKFDTPLPNATYTISFEVKNLKGEWLCQAYGGSNFYYIKEGKNVFTDTGAISQLYFWRSVPQADDEITIMPSVKLELGSIATPYEHPDYNEELWKCQAYYKEYTIAEFNGITREQVTANTDNNWAGALYGILVPKMRRVPSIKLLTDSIVLHVVEPSDDGEVHFTNITDAIVKKVSETALLYFIFNTYSDRTIPKGTRLIMAGKTEDKPFLAFDAEI